MSESMFIHGELVKKNLRIPQMLCTLTFIFILLHFYKRIYPDFICVLGNTEFDCLFNIWLLRELKVLKGALSDIMRFKRVQHLHLLLFEITIIMPT